MSAWPSLEMIVHTLRRGTSATDFGLDAIVLPWLKCAAVPASPTGGKLTKPTGGFP